MKSGKAIAMAIAIGYVVAERRRLRNAAVLGGAAAGQIGASLARDDGGESAGGDALRKLGTATIAAARAALNRPAERLADRLNQKAENLRQGQRPQGRDTEEAPPSTSEGQEVGAGPDNGHLRTGKHPSRSLKYAQEITSPEDDPERPGRSLATTHHEVIKRWAEARGAIPATVPETEHGDHLGVLRFDFGGHNENLKQVSWQQWFDTFDLRRLNFIYQEERADGRRSNFFRLDNPDRDG